MHSTEILDREFLPLRARVIEVAATLDRLERAGGAVDEDPRAAKLLEAIGTLLVEHGNRAEQIQLLFSRPYNEDWRREFRMTNDE